MKSVSISPKVVTALHFLVTVEHRTDVERLFFVDSLLVGVYRPPVSGNTSGTEECQDRSDEVLVYVSTDGVATYASYPSSTT